MSPDFWKPPPPDLRLDLGEVHAWRIELEQVEATVQRLRTVLSPDEVARSDRFHSSVHGRRFLVGRATLRIILGRYLGRPADDLSFELGPHGKPTLADSSRSLRLEFNLTHSQGLAVLAVCLESRIGVDIEAIRPVREIENLVTRFFSLKERQTFLNLVPEDRLAAFYRTWTRKEAYIKAIGTGLTTPLDSFDVGVELESQPGLLSVAGKVDEPRLWTMYDFDPGTNYLGSLVKEGDLSHLCPYLADAASMALLEEI